MKSTALPSPGSLDVAERLRILTADAITQAEINKARGGAGTAAETYAVSLSAFFAAAKAAVDAIVAQA